jgi:hypothetical protein
MKDAVRVLVILEKTTNRFITMQGTVRRRYRFKEDRGLITCFSSALVMQVGGIR